jgi:hypothetical protein
MAHDVPLGCAPDEYDDLISGTCSHLPFGRVNFYGKRPSMILTMNMERVLTQIDTNKRNVFHDGSPNESLSST